MRRNTLIALLVALVVLVGSACEAPLKPKSKQGDGAATAPSPSASARPDAAPSTPAAPAPATPSIRVPRLPRATATVPPPDREPVLGGDISWPQCPKGMGIPQKQGQGSPMPIDAARYVILGLTNGPGFYPNPCLASQVQWVRSRRLMAAAYSVISTPRAGDLQTYGSKGPFDARTPAGALSNVGYQQARFNLGTMRAAGLQSPIIWLDVEPVPEFDWPADTAANAAVVRGAARGYTDAGFAIGAYSTQALWQHVVGDLRLGIPEWRAAGQTSRAEALRRCGPERMFQGGQGVLGQWVEDGRDQNLTCPGTSSQLQRWFHQY
ncbi:MAG: hypothetical protein JWR90_3529 [Marmoricola sp.]|nr:hypothetical protein [Marmoricola sp.]